MEEQNWSIRWISGLWVLHPEFLYIEGEGRVTLTRGAVAPPELKRPRYRVSHYPLLHDLCSNWWPPLIKEAKSSEANLFFWVCRGWSFVRLFVCYRRVSSRNKTSLYLFWSVHKQHGPQLRIILTLLKHNNAVWLCFESSLCIIFSSWCIFFGMFWFSKSLWWCPLVIALIFLMPLSSSSNKFSTKKKNNQMLIFL